MKVLVTGAGGFLGKAITLKLLESGYQVHCLNRSSYLELIEAGAVCFRGDIADPRSAMQAAQGCDAIIHTAAKAGFWGKYRDYFESNVTGTRNVLAACKAMGIQKLVYTSTPSVIHAGGDIEGEDESLPYPEHFLSHYPATKAIAEQEVLAANGPDLATTAIRPHLIWGPGDNHLLPRLKERALAGKLSMIDGGRKLIDTVYIDNAVNAHILALQKLGPGADCAGKAYFITQGEPIALADMITALLKTQGIEANLRNIPLGLAKKLAPLMEVAWKLLPLKGEPPLTRFLFEQFSTAHWYSLDNARRDLGYEATVSLEEGLRRLSA